MSDPVDPDALAEAVAHEDGEFVDPPGDTLAIISAAARAVLEAPTARHCEVHNVAQAAEITSDDEAVICYAALEFGWDDCRFGRVRLVAERSEV